MSGRHVDGFVKGLGPLVVHERPGVTCGSCGMEVATVKGASVAEAVCSWCVTQGPAGQRKAERLAKRKGGRVRK